MAKIKVLYFASLREQLGYAEDIIDVPQAGFDIQSLITLLGEKKPQVKAVLTETPRLRAALNQTLVSFTTAVKPGDEVAFFPPMTGG
ncbi:MULTISPECIES: molybdopterin converting factor subunit 1 [Acetobacter]|uniref:Molybdopterin synthase sulfur carrier subunit n=2 Tax=Acetobacter TaxID=434 RepID=A0ABT3QFR0_9PROT|nr:MULTISPECIES: molybdopterin converting factor subunit 1 [Acetobacter]MBS0959537.1 molybdopterin converting factor subunit 1 [Acetobacter thailandicus]MBS0980013.1 molybdopterin converting factor subunit 1 [Acetobacter thailandicus]MBS0985308.1 molybdopterin converting factor subunit 1 [Acetobacter thailandicus]MBS1002668.1 molybdopterin converting factor subunit 1 [Acetobacter thailandicus]MCX2564086.1 molybdopterin converting factor subunit 1 [Acetobacter thailandicus]